MAPRIVDEREHRRGLILGLTLAEVLLLLLFLLLLALSFALKKRIDAVAKMENEVAAFRELQPVLSNLTGDQAEKIRDLAQRLRRQRETEEAAGTANLDPSQARRLIELMQPFVRERAQIASLEEFLKEAARVDPDDPPAVLRRALAFVRVAGKSIRPEQVSALMPVVKTDEKLREFQGIYERAARVDPNDPPAVLRRGLGMVEEASHLSPTNEAAGNGEHNWPPIITLSEADGYFFATGKAELAPDFERKLREEIIPLLNKLAKKYRVDVIEVTGHTDEQAIVPRNSNLDQILLGVLKNGGPVSSLVPSDNAGLGLARAVAVVRLLMADDQMSGYRVLPMSGGQLIDVGERLTEGRKGDVKERRRIEIRLRRSQQASNIRPLTMQKSSVH
jgi:flagellar motor protein MotB